MAAVFKSGLLVASRLRGGASSAALDPLGGLNASLTTPSFPAKTSGLTEASLLNGPSLVRGKDEGGRVQPLADSSTAEPEVPSPRQVSDAQQRSLLPSQV